MYCHFYHTEYIHYACMKKRQSYIYCSTACSIAILYKKHYIKVYVCIIFKISNNNK